MSITDSQKDRNHSTHQRCEYAASNELNGIWLSDTGSWFVPNGILRLNDNGTGTGNKWDIAAGSLARMNVWQVVVRFMDEGSAKA